MAVGISVQFLLQVGKLRPPVRKYFNHISKDHISMGNEMANCSVSEYKLKFTF